LRNTKNIGFVVIITQKTLQDINPAYLSGWNVVLDEVPDITNVHTKDIGENLFKDTFDHLITWDEKGNVSIQDGKEFDVRIRLSEAGCDKSMSTQTLVFKALLKRHAEVKIRIDNNKNPLKYWLDIVDYHDYKAIIQSCDDFHIMGNAIEKSLFYHYVVANGFEIKVSEYTPAHKRYKMKPTLVPLFEGKKYSKRMLLQGGDGERMSYGSVGYKAVERAFSYVNGKEVLFQGNSWMSVPGAFPFKKYSNVKIIPSDARGMNTYSGVNYSIHMMHGNPKTNLKNSYTRMLKMMGVDKESGMAAIRHEMSTERTVQGITRTPIRKFEEQKHVTVHIVPTLEEAKKLEIELGVECFIDESIMVKTPPTVTVSNRDELKQRAWGLYKQGKNFRAIGKQLGKSPSTIYKWIKELEEKEMQQEKFALAA
tara:strand:+ start:3657 stop:4925 length:1269 start_codon:yes stop_codon:yes gene_type:complete